MIDVKEAVRLANEHLVHLLGEDAVSSVRLEEVELMRKEEMAVSYWLITLSYLSNLSPSLISGLAQRQYKIFKIDAETGEFISMRMRKVA